MSTELQVLIDDAFSCGAKMQKTGQDIYVLLVNNGYDTIAKVQAASIDDLRRLGIAGGPLSFLLKRIEEKHPRNGKCSCCHH